MTWLYFYVTTLAFLAVVLWIGNKSRDHQKSLDHADSHVRLHAELQMKQMREAQRIRREDEDHGERH